MCNACFERRGSADTWFPKIIREVRKDECPIMRGLTEFPVLKRQPHDDYLLIPLEGGEIGNPVQFEIIHRMEATA